MIFKIRNIKISTKIIISLMILITLFFGFLSDDVGLNGNIQYLNDILLAFLLLGSLIGPHKQFKMKSVTISVVAFSLVALMSIILNLVPINLVIWAVRNTYRFFAFFWLCAIYLNKDNIDFIFNLMYRIQYINVVLILYQYFILHLRGDHIGGIFGHGGNSGTLIYSSILLAYAFSKYIFKEYKLSEFLFILISTMIICALAEIRVFFLIVPIILAISFFYTKFSYRKIIIIIGIFILAVVSIKIYEQLFPYVNLSISSFIEEGTSTGGGYNISRINGFSEINQIFFKNDVLKNLFGYGFGYCEYSSIDFFSSEFYSLYGAYNYRWFASQWTFLETGYLGVISYCSILISIIICSIKKMKTVSKENKSLMLTTTMVGTICLVLFFYNSLLKADYGYLPFFVLSIVAIIQNQKNDIIKEKNI